MPTHVVRLLNKKKDALFRFKNPTGPWDILHMKVMITTLSILGFWPDSVMGKKRWYSGSTKFTIGFYVVIFFLSVTYIRNNIRRISFLDMGANYINTLLVIVVLLKLVLPMTQKYIRMTRYFVTKIHLFHYKDQSEFTMKMFKEVEKFSAFFCLLLHCEVGFGAIFYNLTPLYKSYRNGMFRTERPPNATFEQAVYYEFPLNYDTELNGFIIIYSMNWFFTTYVSFLNGILDLYVFVLVFNVWGHLKILIYNLTHFPRPQLSGTGDGMSFSWYSESESDHVRELLIESIEHYKLIKEFVSEMSSTFGAAMCGYFCYFQICGCILLVESFEMTAEAFGTYGILTLVTFQQLIQISVIFELISTQSDSIPRAVYEVPWECMDVKNRKIVLFYITITQIPLNFKPMGMVSIGVQTMASILKTSISYFMLLRTVTTE